MLLESLLLELVLRIMIVLSDSRGNNVEKSLLIHNVSIIFTTIYAVSFFKNECKILATQVTWDRR